MQIIDDFIKAIREIFKLHPEHNNIQIEKPGVYINKSPLLVFSNEFSLSPLGGSYKNNQGKIITPWLLKGSLDCYTRVPYQGADLLSWLFNAHENGKFNNVFKLGTLRLGYNGGPSNPSIETTVFVRGDDSSFWHSKLFVHIEFSKPSDFKAI